ncbi:MAG TPA: alpha/beta hydrolase-fold protein [Anaerolineales bacterium]|nr:alpha/beta hydrolase-fold protein [Anaerolineales bacterium]
MRRSVSLFALAALAACVVQPSSTGGQPSPAPATEVRPTLAAAAETPFSPSTPNAACADPQPQTIDRSYSGAAVNGEVPVFIVLPPCYESSGTTYPVVYFLHGKPMTETQWRDLGLPETLAQGWGEGRWPALIAVAPRLPEPIFSNSDGGPGSYEDEFFQGLVPFIESTVLAETQPGGRAIVGISRGGVWALELALTHPDTVGSAAGLSPALAVNYARAAYDPLQLAGQALSLPRVFLGAGRDDWARLMTERLATELEGRDGDVELSIVEGSHEEATWLRLLPQALDFLTEPWEAFGGPASGIKVESRRGTDDRD